MMRKNLVLHYKRQSSWMFVKTTLEHLQMSSIYTRGHSLCGRALHPLCLHKHTTQDLLLQIDVASLCCLTLPLPDTICCVAFPAYQCATRCACFAAHAHQQCRQCACLSFEKCDASLVSIALAQGLSSLTAGQK